MGHLYLFPCLKEKTSKMIKIKTFVFNPFQENTYVLSDDSGECIIVDAGCYGNSEFESLVNYIESNHLKPVKLVNTHCHVDHVLGISAFMKRYNVSFETNQKEVPFLEDAKVHGKVFGFQVEQPPLPTHYLVDEEELKFGNSVLKILEVPGHSLGSIAFYSAEDKFVIVGDVLFKGSIGRTDLPTGDYDQLMKSIFSKLMVLDHATVVLPGHGPYTTLGEELLSNPFLS
jgi:hydroxyacylglutathione hydrolase